MNYREIAESLHEIMDVRGACLEATEAMKMHFPELRRVRGFVTLMDGSEHAHWWLVAPDGEIVDPTRAQFDPAIALYDPLDESKPEPVGKCANCGELAYDEKLIPVCSEKCGIEYAAYCMGAADTGRRDGRSRSGKF